MCGLHPADGVGQQPGLPGCEPCVGRASRCASAPRHVCRPAWSLTCTITYTSLIFEWIHKRIDPEVDLKNVGEIKELQIMYSLLLSQAFLKIF